MTQIRPAQPRPQLGAQSHLTLVAQAPSHLANLQIVQSRTLECRISRSTIYSSLRRSWQALLPGIDKPHISRASTSPSSPGSFDKRLAYPSASRQIATAETRLLVYLARKGTAPCHLPTLQQARSILDQSCHSQGRTTTRRAGGKVQVYQPCCSLLGILWGSTPQSSPHSYPSPDDGGERKL